MIGSAQIPEVSPAASADSISRFARLAFLTQNLLIQRDLQQIRRKGFRQPTLWFPLAIACAGGVILYILQGSGPNAPALGDTPLYISFAAFHGYLLIFLPLYGLRTGRKLMASSHVQACRLTPIHERDYFWWLWSRSMALGLLPLLLFYFALFPTYPWLFEWAETFNYASLLQPIWLVYLGKMLPCDLLMVVLFLAPFARTRFSARLALWVPVILLGFVSAIDSNFDSAIQKMGSPITREHGSDWPLLFPTYDWFHPAITLTYFFMAAAWSSALGAALAMKSGLSLRRAFLLAFAAGPLFEAVYLHAVFFTGIGGLYDNWSFLYLMLLSYTFSFGPLILGLKWNAMIYLARKVKPGW